MGVTAHSSYTSLDGTLARVFCSHASANATGRHLYRIAPRLCGATMEGRMSVTARLRELLHGDGIVVAPGAYDALSARIIERVGFPAVYLTGAGITGALLGMTDLGLITMTEIV